MIGTGLIGTSIALALRERGVRVWLADRDPAAAKLAADLGAGEILPEPELAGAAQGRAEQGGARPRADLAILAVPPAAVAPGLAAAQAAGLARWYTDVASVKGFPLAAARELGCDLSSFAGGHPLSGRERSGPAPARSDLFLGRPWVICPGQETAAGAVAAATALVRCCRAEPVLLSAAEHDTFVALISHAPHVVAAAVAARLAEAPAAALTLAGPGLADVTRIAGGDPGLWTQILAANSEPVAQVLAAVAADLAAAADALASSGRAASLKVVAGLLEGGAAGVARLPGKRGLPPLEARDDVVVQVVIPDQPGELAKLFQVAGDAGVNIEDFGIEHSPGLPVGVAELTVRPGAADRLAKALAAAGWPVRR